MELLHHLPFSLSLKGPLAVGPLQAQGQVLEVAQMGQYPWASCNQVPWARLEESPRCNTSCPRCPSSFKWHLPQQQPLGPSQQLPVVLCPPPASVSLSHRAPPPTARSWPPLHPLLASPSCSLYPLPHPLKVRHGLGSTRIGAICLLGSVVTKGSSYLFNFQPNQFRLCRPHPQVALPSCYLGRY